MSNNVGESPTLLVACCSEGTLSLPNQRNGMKYSDYIAKGLNCCWYLIKLFSPNHNSDVEDITEGLAGVLRVNGDTQAPAVRERILKSSRGRRRISTFSQYINICLISVSNLSASI